MLLSPIVLPSNNIMSFVKINWPWSWVCGFVKSYARVKRMKSSVMKVEKLEGVKMRGEMQRKSLICCWMCEREMNVFWVGMKKIVGWINKLRVMRHPYQMLRWQFFISYHLTFTDITLLSNIYSLTHQQLRFFFFLVNFCVPLDLLIN